METCVSRSFCSGFLARTPRGRIATARAYAHLGFWHFRLEPIN